MADKDPIDEKALDDLLRNLYLDEKSKTVDENEAQFIMEQDYAVKIDPKKEKQLLEKLQNKSSGFSGYKLFFSVFIAFVLISLFVWHFIPKTNNALNKSTSTNPQNNSTEQVNNSNE